MEEKEKEQPTDAIRPDVLNYDDIVGMVPKLQGHRRLVEAAMRFISLDKVNKLHADSCQEAGAPCARRLLENLDITLDIDNAEVLDHLPEGAFITVSNHHFGALDGIILIDLIGSRRPTYKVMVNMVLNHVTGLRPSFIAVDPQASADPKKKAVSMRGIKEVIRQVREGNPVGFFPAGAVAKVNWRGRLQDREWQESVLRLIQQLKVPVIPIFFHGSQSWWFNFLGVVCWQLRQILHPREVFRKYGKTFHVTVGQPISPEEQAEHTTSLKDLGDFLRRRTYELRDGK